MQKGFNPYLQKNLTRRAIENERAKKASSIVHGNWGWKLPQTITLKFLITLVLYVK